jgi:hypothetical protein
MRPDLIRPVTAMFVASPWMRVGKKGIKDFCAILEEQLHHAVVHGNFSTYPSMILVHNFKISSAVILEAFS